MEEITYLGETNYRHTNKTFGIRQQDRLSHTYIIGKTGTGKSTLLLQLMLQDIENKQGFALIDPHGDLAERLTDNLPEGKKGDLIYLDAIDNSCLFGFNPLKKVSQSKRSLVASGTIEILKKLYDAKSWGNKMEHILRNVLLTLLDQDKVDFFRYSKNPSRQILSKPVYRQHHKRRSQKFLERGIRQISSISKV